MKESLLRVFKENWAIIFTGILIIAAFCLFYNCYGDIIVDSYREAYIPWQMNRGEVLYKNIFCIYPPLGYIINALIFKIFGTNLAILKLIGLILTIGIFLVTHKIARMFLTEFEFAGIGLFFFAGLVISANVFNPILPYSFGIMYSLLFILLSIYFCINKNFPLSYLFYSLAILAKYEFIFLLPVLIFVSRKAALKQNMIALFSPIILVFLYLKVSGCSYTDIIDTFNILKTMGGTETLKEFYTCTGMYFRWEHIHLYISNFFKFIIPINWNEYQSVIIWIFPFITLLFLFRFKKLDYIAKIFIIASLIVSAKIFFALTLQSYGVYFIPFALISLLLLVSKKLRTIIVILLIAWSLIIGTKQVKTLSHKNFKYLEPVIEYIKNTPADSKVLVLPEGLSINFLSKRNSDNKIYSLIPLYIETFKEDTIIKRIELSKPDYIIINDFKTPYYIYNQFGADYGLKITELITKSYTYIKTYDGDYIFKVYKRN